MKKKYINFLILIIVIPILYFNYKLTIQYYTSNLYDCHITSNTDKIVFTPDTPQTTLDITIKNNTRKVISSENKMYLSYHIIDKAGKEIKFDNERSTIPKINPYNQLDNIPMSITNINKKGEYTLLVDIVEENVTWFSQKGNSTFSIDMIVE